MNLMQAMNQLFLEAREQAVRGWTLHLQDLEVDERQKEMASLPEWLRDALH